MSKKRYILRQFLVAAIFFLAECAAFSEPNSINLAKADYTWSAVLSGRALSRPVRTSYGFAVITDGKMVTAFTDTGTVLWQKGVPGNPLPFMRASSGDFLFVPLKGKKICALNPSGVVLWKADLSFEAKAAPLCGRDGRIFVFGKNEAACLGANGRKKWQIQTETLNLALEPSELEDGSFLLWTGGLEAKKSVALRVSPFGEVLERIVFAGEVTASFSCMDGVLLSFSDGSMGLCSFDQKTGSALSKWVTKEAGLSRTVRFSPTSSPEKVALLSVSGNSNNSRLLIVDTKSGRIEKSAAPKIEAQDVSFCEGVLFVDGAKEAALFPLGNKNGSLECACTVRFPEKTKALNWDYALYSSGTVLFTARDWSVKGFAIGGMQAKGGAKNSKKTQKKTGYMAYTKSVREDIRRIRGAASASRKEALEKGGYGADEIEFTYDAKYIMDSYFSSKMKRSSLGGTITDWTEDELTSFNLREQTAVLSMLCLFESSWAQEYLARVLESEQDVSVLFQALKGVQECGYDEDGRIMAAIEQIIQRAKPAQAALLDQCCEALYSVCRFMGRPALYRKGLSVLQNLMMPQYPESTKESARKVYEKLAKLRL